MEEDIAYTPILYTPVLKPELGTNKQLYVVCLGCRYLIWVNELPNTVECSYCRAKYEIQKKESTHGNRINN